MRRPSRLLLRRLPPPPARCSVHWRQTRRQRIAAKRPPRPTPAARSALPNSWLRGLPLCASFSDGLQWTLESVLGVYPLGKESGCYATCPASEAADASGWPLGQLESARRESASTCECGSRHAATPARWRARKAAGGPVIRVGSAERRGGE